MIVPFHMERKACGATVVATIEYPKRRPPDTISVAGIRYARMPTARGKDRRG